MKRIIVTALGLTASFIMFSSIANTTDSTNVNDAPALYKNACVNCHGKGPIAKQYRTSSPIAPVGSAPISLKTHATIVCKNYHLDCSNEQDIKDAIAYVLKKKFTKQ